MPEVSHVKSIMADNLIPEDVRQFIVDKIDSVAELEGLLLFSKNPEIEWNAETLAQTVTPAAHRP